MRLKLGEAREALLACGQCHRTDAAEAVREFHDAVDVLRIDFGETGADEHRIDCGDGGCNQQTSGQHQGSRCTARALQTNWLGD